MDGLTFGILLPLDGSHAWPVSTRVRNLEQRFRFHRDSRPILRISAAPAYRGGNANWAFELFMVEVSLPPDSPPWN